MHFVLERPAVGSHSLAGYRTIRDAKHFGVTKRDSWTESLGRWLGGRMAMYCWQIRRLIGLFLRILHLDSLTLICDGPSLFPELPNFCFFLLSCSPPLGEPFYHPSTHSTPPLFAHVGTGHRETPL
jgi:hypothetical protein